MRTSIGGFWVIDAKGNILQINDAYCSLIGYSRDELLSMNIRGVEALELSGEAAAHIQQILATGSHRFDTHHRRKDGTLVGLEVSDNHLDLYGGRIFTYFRDITERKRAEEGLREHRDHLEEVVEERTAELRLLVNSMAGREVRMAELKQVIRQLRTQMQEAGLAPVADDPLAAGMDERS